MNKKIVSVLIGLFVLAVCIGIFQWTSSVPENESAVNAFENAVNADEQSIDSAYTQAVEESITQKVPEEPAQDVSLSATNYPARVENGLLTLGAPDAPVTIMEFSSLSCPHCSTFHKGSLKNIKTDYVDTGKVKFIFQDFPLNQQALHGSMLLRCVDGQTRYELMELLFDQQEQWAFDVDHQTKLKQYAALVGVSNDKADACMSDTNTEQSILTLMKAVSQRYSITSTPSFVLVPGEKVLTGALPYGSFSTEIEKILNQ